MRDIRLVCTDLDGTILSMDQDDRIEDFQRFREVLRNLRGLWNAQWAVVTGRNLTSLESLLAQFLLRGLAPEFLVLEDAHIHRRTKYGAYRGAWWWNLRVRARRQNALRRNRALFLGWRRDLEAAVPGATELAHDPGEIWYRYESEAEAVRAEELLRAKVAASPLLYFVFRWGCEVAAVSNVGTKGEAIGEICRCLRIPRRTVFAIGDGPNDASMLDGVAAGMPACVANATPQIQGEVRQAGGYVAAAPSLGGVLEALEAYMTGTMSATPRPGRAGVRG